MNTLYDIFKHGKNVRVVGIKSSRKGMVVDIRETGYEWIEPLVLFDDKEEPEFVFEPLMLVRVKGVESET